MERSTYIDSSNCNTKPEPDEYLNQQKSTNKYQTLFFPVGNSNQLLEQSEKIKDSLYALKTEKYNVIIIKIGGKDILKPEIVLQYLYDKDLATIKNKKYVLLNKFEGKIDYEFYENMLSVVLKSRSTENFCTVVLESDNINQCYQPTFNKEVQVIQEENGQFGIDMKRSSGPEAIWRTTEGMKKEWRNGYEEIIKELIKLSK